MLKITKNRIFFTLLNVILLTDVFIKLSNQNQFLGIFVFISIIFVPGIILLLLLRTKGIGFWKFLTYSVGSSLTYLLCTGLISNFIWQQRAISMPLATPALYVVYNTILLPLLVIAYLRYNTQNFALKLPKLTLSYILAIIVPPIILTISICGTLILNNGGTNALIMLALGGMAFYMGFLIFRHNSIPSFTFPYTIFFFSLTLLLMLSLRSSFITGWDIQDEFHIFQITKNAGYWNPLYTKDDYNSCLSITILPTYISAFTHIADMYIFKILYQILFSFVPLVIYSLFRKYTERVVSFLSSIYFISQPFFIQPMTALMRQEVAFLFFALFLLVTFEQKLKQHIKEVLLILFGLSLIVSHYSMTYISLIILISTLGVVSLFRLSEKFNTFLNFYQKLGLHSKQKHIKYQYLIYPEVLLVLFLSAIVWYSLVNKNASHAIKVGQSLVQNVKNIFTSDIANQESQKAIAVFATSSFNSQKTINAYVFQEVQVFKYDKNLKYSLADIKNNLPVATLPKTIPSQLGTNISNIATTILQIIKQISKLFVVIGLLYLLIREFGRKTYDREFLILAVLSEIFIAVMIINPTLAAEYNLSRLYLQLLTILALPGIIGGLFFFTFLKKYAIYAMGILMIIVFLYFTGFMNQYIGGEALMHLNNFGTDFDKFYVKAMDIAATKWLSANRNTKLVVFADRTAQLRMTFVPYMYIDNNVIPQIIFKNSYVFSDYANTHDNITDAYFQGNDITYTFPTNFLNENKNLIYNNGGSKVYR